MSAHPYVSEWRESRLPEWRETDLADRITLVQCATTQTNRLTLVVDQVASVKSAPAHQPKRIASVSRATAREQAVERAQWLEHARSPRHTIGARLTYAAAAALLVATGWMAFAGQPSELDALRADALSLQDAQAAAVLAASARK